MTRDKGTNVNKINMTLASCMLFFRQKIREKRTASKRRKTESLCSMARKPNQSSFNRRPRAGKTRRETSPWPITFIPIFFWSQQTHCPEETSAFNDSGTGTNTGPKTGVVRVTYKRTPDEVSNSKPRCPIQNPNSDTLDGVALNGMATISHG